MVFFHCLGNISCGMGASMDKQCIKTSLSARHIMVVAAGILLCLGPCALVYNTWSIFVVPVSTALGASSSQFTLYITLVYLIGGLASPVAGNLMERFDLRIVLSISVLFVVIGMGLCSFWNQIWQFYISGVLIGFGIVSLMFLAVPTLINRWFVERTGFFIGLCFSMSGVGGALWSMVGGIVFSIADWRSAYLLFALLVLVTGLIATVVLIRSYPSEVGLEPYGTLVDSKMNNDNLSESEFEQLEFTNPHSVGAGTSCDSDTNDAKADFDAKGKQWGVPARVMFRSPVFYTLMITMGIFNALTVVGNLFATYIYYLGDSGSAGITPDSAIMLASAVAACIMVLSAVSKVLLGAVSDKSLVVALCIPCICGSLSILCMWFGAPLSSVFVYAGGLLCGVLYAAVDALGASFTRQIAGPRDYTLIYSRVAIIVNLAGAVSATLFAAVAEISWEAEWIMALSLIAITFVLGMVTIKKGKRLEQTYE